MPKFAIKLLPIMVLLFLLSAPPLHAEEQIPVPKIPSSGKTPKDFVPKDWDILVDTEGDLNKDGIPDKVLVLKSIHEQENDAQGLLKYAEAPRVLAILFKTAQGDYRLSTSTAKAILCYNCGGVLGDPFQEMKIDRGVLVIVHYGGSNLRWGFTHRWRYQDNDWYLIGKTNVKGAPLNGEEESKDVNLLTGDEVIETTTSGGKTTSRHLIVPKKPLQKLSSIDVTKP